MAILGQAVKSAGIRNGNVALFSKMRHCEPGVITGVITGVVTGVKGVIAGISYVMCKYQYGLSCGVYPGV